MSEVTLADYMVVAVMFLFLLIVFCVVAWPIVVAFKTHGTVLLMLIGLCLWIGNS